MPLGLAARGKKMEVTVMDNGGLLTWQSGQLSSCGAEEEESMSVSE